jgi:hypothetical protein
MTALHSEASFPVTTINALDIAAPPENDEDLFVGGATARLEKRIGLGPPNNNNIVRRAVLVVLLAWFPLALFTAINDLLSPGHSFLTFLSDYGVHARFLVAAPLLVLAEVVASRRLGTLSKHLRTAGVVHDDDLPRLDEVVQRMHGLRDSFFVELGIVFLVLSFIGGFLYFTPLKDLPAWNSSALTLSGHSVASWWHTLISVPILLMLVCGWVWRIFLWAWFLLRVSRLRLEIIASHSDGAGGLKFLGLSLQDCAIVAFGLGTIISGTIGNQVLYHGASILDFRYGIAGFAALIVLLFTGPLFVFFPKLLEAKRAGILKYGGLARAFGHEFEDDWFNRTGKFGKDDVRDPNFSSTTDLYSIVANAFGMKMLPLSLSNLIVLAVAAMLPFVPVALMSIPAQVIFEQVRKLLF